MKRLMTACAVAAACAASAGAQDTTVKSKTKVDADDAKVVTMTGCLQAGAASGVFTLNGVASGLREDLESKSKTTVDVDDDETEVQTKTRTEVEKDDDERAVGTAGMKTTYELVPKEGLDLQPHVGRTVAITAVVLEPRSATDDDADIELKTETKVEREDAADSKVKSRTRAELPRGAAPRLTAVTVKPIAASCTPQ